MPRKEFTSEGAFHAALKELLDAGKSREANALARNKDFLHFNGIGYIRDYSLGDGSIRLPILRT